PMVAEGWARVAAAAAGADRRLARGLDDVEGVQRRLLAELIARNAGTAFGRGHGFPAIATAEDWRRRLPVSPYERFRPHLDRVVAGEPAVLTAEPVRFLELTGGSTGGAKVIPYTDGLLAGFRAALLP